MKIVECSDYEVMSHLAAGSIESSLGAKPKQWIAMASGNSPIGLYAKLGEAYLKNPVLFKGMGVVKLDEWCGIAPDAANSCEAFLDVHIIRPLQIPRDRYISFNGNELNTALEVARVQRELWRIGGIDSCILGLGKNGHLGFNEPNVTLEAHCHMATLSKTSQQHAMITGPGQRPTKGLTLGMADIMYSKQIILLVSGKGKEKSLETLLSGQITTQCPASLLNLHANTHCFIDQSSF